MSDDFPRFNVMPKRPLSVEDTGKNNEWWSGRLGYLPKDHWHEVSDPIVWDGTDAMIAEVAAALPSPWECHKAFLLNHHLRIQLVNDFADLNVWVEPGWRIQIVDDSFAILPPEVTP